MKEFIGLLIVAVVLVVAVVTGRERSRKGKGELGGKPADPSRPSEK
jgi:hypothetical protein